MLVRVISWIALAVVDCQNFHEITRTNTNQNISDLSQSWFEAAPRGHTEQNRNSRRMVFQFQEAIRPMRDPVLAGILSLLIPGVGQLYNGRILAGILWLIFTPGFWIGTGGTLGWICHLIAAYTAYSYAKDHPVRV